MGYVVRTPLKIFKHFSLISHVFINIHEYLGFNLVPSRVVTRMSCCLDTNHFVGTFTFFIIILWIFTLWGGGGGINCSRQVSLSQFFLCYLVTILFCQYLTTCFS